MEEIKNILVENKKEDEDGEISSDDHDQKEDLEPSKLK